MRPAKTRKTLKLTDHDLHKTIKILAVEKGVTIEEIIRAGIEALQERKAEMKADRSEAL